MKVFWRKFFYEKFTTYSSIKSNFKENFIIFTLLENQDYEVLGVNFCGVLKTWKRLQEFKSVSITGKIEILSHSSKISKC